ncbi:hypothetical protein ACFQ09_20575 [Massilia norwichensis]|uniref:Uncharacterized protein n=1 Tax=Massilia norwichensis TaxID=1442366 RepID=A0ABT2A2F0_9BURK|nr:hypothetical protein [Massilia norwichensis]MCS0588252.1 hypothetical protein [Massilia norwichensis]
MSGDLSRLSFAVSLLRSTRRVIKQNLWVSVTGLLRLNKLSTS